MARFPTILANAARRAETGAVSRAAAACRRIARERSDGRVNRLRAAAQQRNAATDWTWVTMARSAGATRSTAGPIRRRDTLQSQVVPTPGVAALGRPREPRGMAGRLPLSRSSLGRSGIPVHGSGTCDQAARRDGFRSAMAPRLPRSWSGLLVAFVLAGVCAGPAAAKPDKEEIRALKRAAALAGLDSKIKPQADLPPARNQKPHDDSAGAPHRRALDRLRDRMEVGDEDEWRLIAERILRVDAARRSVWAPPSGGPFSPEKTKGEAGKNAEAERNALRSALSERLPDAELALRLARARETNRQNETRLAQAQSDLRAILSVRQEAVAVMAGLLPP